MTSLTAVTVRWQHCAVHHKPRPGNSMGHVCTALALANHDQLMYHYCACTARTCEMHLMHHLNLVDNGCKVERAPLVFEPADWISQIDSRSHDHKEPP